MLLGKGDKVRNVIIPAQTWVDLMLMGSLMTEFYQNLQKNRDKAQALRQAMLTTMKQHPDRKNWAAFTLIGEAE